MTEWKLQLRHLFKEEIKKDIDRYSDRYAEIPSLPQQNCDIGGQVIGAALHSLSSIVFMRPKRVYLQIMSRMIFHQ